MTQEMVNNPSESGSRKFAVVITDGHVTGNPCEGIKVTAERAREAGIKTFVVAASKNVDETGLKEIANSPATVYRRDFMAVDLSQGRAIIQDATIDRIIQTMVAHTKTCAHTHIRKYAHTETHTKTHTHTQVTKHTNLHIDTSTIRNHTPNHTHQTHTHAKHT